MKPLALILCLSLAAPAFAGDEAPAAPPDQRAEQGDMSRGLGLMQEGTRLMLRGLLSQAGPKMRDMMTALTGLMGDLNAYEPPQVLPNGDILIRRKIPLVPIPPGDKGNATDL